ncbi:MAG: glycosyltransferase [Egibacteraceae bacterium]
MDCRAEVKYVDEGEADELDVLIFNHEPQWYLLERFARARFRVFLALGCAASYAKSGGWESLHCAVDLRLANSAWTADCLERETGVRPSVVPTGVNREVFHPVETPKRYPVLCAGDKRAWKGTDVIEAACALLDLPLEKLQGKDLAQETLAEEFCKAEVFAVGSPVEGFGQPGLEALACGVALVTTDNGGSREYAIDEETALVVPPGDPAAMAAAIRRLRADPGLRDRLRHNGLETAKRFSWDTAAEGLERELVGLVSGAIPALPRPADGRLRRPQREPLLSVIVLAWNQLELTQRCIESIRRCTDLPYELIAVDNGSTDDTASYLAAAADVAILNPDNRGFSAGFNQGLARASGEYVCFLNNDTKVPSGWASRLVETISEAPSIGALLPAVTAAPNDITVRGEPRDHVAILPAFREPPSGIALVMRTAIARALGGWGEEYELASAEDTDLFFKLWVNGLDVVLDEAVLVDHVGKASAKQLPDWKQRWIENRHVFLDKWTGSLEDLPRLESCPEALFERNKQLASSVATWMQRYFRKKDQRPAGAGVADLLPQATRARSAKQLDRPVAARPVAVDREVVIEADRSRDSKPLHDREARAIDDREGLAGKGHSDL